MGRKKAREKYVSKGIVGHPMRHRANHRERLMHKLNAWLQGKPVTLSVPDPTRRDDTRMKVPAIEWWGSPKPKTVKVEDES